MYCGGELPAADATAEEGAAPGPSHDAATEDRREQARKLLRELSPQARALMPEEVLRELEERAGAAAPSEPSAAPAPSTTAPSPKPLHRPFGLQPPPPPAPDRPSRSLSPVRAGGEHAVAGFVDPLPAAAKTAPAAAAPVGASPPGDPSAPLGAALLRGRGPFGPRHPAFRMFLLPDSGYRGNAPWLKHRLASTLGIDLYTATQQLQRDTPTFLAAGDERAPLDSRAAHLRAGGLRCILLPWHELVAAARPQAIERLDLPPPAPIRLAVLGEVDPDPRPEPGEPARNRWGLAERPAEREIDPRAGPYLLLDLFMDSTPAPLRIRSDSFDFSVLGSGRGLSALLNLRRLLQRLAPPDEAPIPVDERFRRVPRLLVHARGGDSTDDDGAPAAPFPTLQPPPQVPEREVEFTEYSLILDAGRRGESSGPVPGSAEQA
jgi:hypothetical protein